MLKTDPIAIYRESRAPKAYPFGIHQSPAGPAWTHAKRCARIQRRWVAAESAGLVRFRVESDPDGWESYFDGDMFVNPTHPGGARALAADKREAERLAESWGFVGVVGEYRTDPDSDEWTHAASIWGIRGDESPEDAAGYGPDIMGETLCALADSLRRESRKRADLRRNCCPHCRGTGRAD